MLNSKMKGIVDPFTLGIIISIVGVIVVNVIHADQQPAQQSDIELDARVLIPENKPMYKRGDDLVS